MVCNAAKSTGARDWKLCPLFLIHSNEKRIMRFLKIVLCGVLRADVYNSACSHLIGPVWSEGRSASTTLHKCFTNSRQQGSCVGIRLWGHLETLTLCIFDMLLLLSAVSWWLLLSVCHQAICGVLVLEWSFTFMALRFWSDLSLLSVTHLLSRPFSRESCFKSSSRAGNFYKVSSLM